MGQEDMDLWEEVAAGTNVWVCARELYHSISLCFANRGDAAVVVEVDYSRSENVLPLTEPDPLRAALQRTRRYISPRRTVVVVVFSPLDDVQPMNIDYSCHVMEAATFSPLSTDLSSDMVKEVDFSVTMEAEQQSAQVKHWLQTRQ
jgi:hypothetical protein